MTPPSHRVELRADSQWLQRVYDRAIRMNVSRTALIRLAVSQYLEMTDPNTPPGQSMQPGPAQPQPQKNRPQLPIPKWNDTIVTQASVPATC